MPAGAVAGQLRLPYQSPTSWEQVAANMQAIQRWADGQIVHPVFSTATQPDSWTSTTTDAWEVFADGDHPVEVKFRKQDAYTDLKVDASASMSVTGSGTVELGVRITSPVTEARNPLVAQAEYTVVYPVTPPAKYLAAGSVRIPSLPASLASRGLSTYVANADWTATLMVRCTGTAEVSTDLGFDHAAVSIMEVAAQPSHLSI